MTDKLDRPLTVWELQSTLEGQLAKTASNMRQVVLATFQHDFLDREVGAEDFLSLVPVRFPPDIFGYFKLGEKGYSPNDLFWGIPDANPHLPNVFTQIFDNYGKPVLNGAAAERVTKEELETMKQDTRQ